MKLKIHLECFAMRKDLLTEKTKCQVLFCQWVGSKQFSCLLSAHANNDNFTCMAS